MLVSNGYISLTNNSDNATMFTFHIFSFTEMATEDIIIHRHQWNPAQTGLYQFRLMLAITTFKRTEIILYLYLRNPTEVKSTSVSSLYF